MSGEAAARHAPSISGERLEMMLTAPLHIHGQVVTASNITTLVNIGGAGSDFLGIYKPRAGERPLWDFPEGTLHQREVAAFVVSEFLGWDLVPPTIVRDDAPLGVGSLQMFVEHDPRTHYFTLIEDTAHDAQLARMATFDVVVNNADRKGSHVLLDDSSHIWGCDHGLTFHVEPKLRTVIWDFAGSALDQRVCHSLLRLADAADDPDSDLAQALDGLLTQSERRAVAERARALARVGVLPEPDEDRRPYPWPLL